MTTITVGAAPPRFHAFADYVDGETAIVHRAGISIEPGGDILHIDCPDHAALVWPLEDVRRIRDQAGGDGVVVSSATQPMARLMVRDAEAAEILRLRCPKLRRNPQFRGKWRLFAWGGAALSSVALIIFVLIPVMANQLAGFIPPDGEKALGDTTFEQIRMALGDGDADGLRVCDDPDGTAALDVMLERFEPNLLVHVPLTVNTLDSDIINAFALPGGYVTFFDGLIQEAETPEEVAAVFAHEIGHVAHRDPTRIALRTAGSLGVLGLILGDFAGGTAVLFLVERLIQAQYSQDAEAFADDFAHELMARSGLPPSAMATFFERLREEYGEDEGLTRHFAAHPQMGDRIAAARAFEEEHQPVITPLLTDQQWADLRGICGS